MASARGRRLPRWNRPGAAAPSPESGAPARRGALTLDGVSKSYGGRCVLQPLRLEISAGEFFSVLGPSGSGKTTTLMLIAGFTDPDAGDIHLDGTSIVGQPPARRNIGVVFQNYALFPHLDVFENVGFALRVRGVPEAEMRDRVRDALTLVGLEGYERRLPAQLSGGQQQRVALARAVIFEPAILLMDEPLGALDRQLRLQLQVELRNLQRTLGVTIVYVTHDQEEAMSMSDRIAILSDGELQQVGAPRDIYESPANEFVASFIGDSNIADARCHAADGPSIDLLVSEAMRITADQPGSITAGQRVRVLIRPEAITVNTDVSGTPAEWIADVEEAMYLGDQVKCLLRLPSGVRLVARVTGQRASAALTAGGRVAVSIAPSAVRVFDAPSGGESAGGDPVAQPAGGAQAPAQRGQRGGDDRVRL